MLAALTTKYSTPFTNEQRPLKSIFKNDTLAIPRSKGKHTPRHWELKRSKLFFNKMLSVAVFPDVVKKVSVLASMKERISKTEQEEANYLQDDIPCPDFSRH